MTSKDLKRKFKFYEDKISSLWSKKQRVEALLYMSLLVELFVKEAILTFEKIIEGAAVQHHVNFNPRNLYSREDIENQPLGYLIKILNTYTKDKALIKMLTQFSKTRNKCIHKLLDHEMKDVHKDLKDFNKFYYKLMIKLMQLNVKQMDLVHKSFHHMCDDCFKKMLPRQIKL
ncbi:MAG: hypothetical protein UW97_C0015G0015 [Parcubacteria group bacterium GW2011_GWA2_45_15]|nr:MAG: hypothetical protein UW97_C0015G0015 [Parcubacteria group bacterium GW2011_GWA2_45_15]